MPHTEVMPQLDRDPLHVLHAEVDVLTHVFARPLPERLQVEEALGPVAVPLVPVVRLLHPERDPSESRLGEEHLQIRNAIEHAGHDHLCETQRRRQAEQGHPFDDGASRNLGHGAGIGVTVDERRLRRTRPESIESDVDRERHLHEKQARIRSASTPS